MFSLNRYKAVSIFDIFLIKSIYNSHKENINYIEMTHFPDEIVSKVWLPTHVIIKYDL